MIRIKTFVLGVIVAIALSLFSESSIARERQKKRHAKDTTEVSKPNPYEELVKKAKISTGVVKILTIENDY